MQRFAQRPPAQALLLPPPDSEAPDDLFPLKPARKAQQAQPPAISDEQLLDLWVVIKHKINQYDIQNYQIANWFDKNYHLEVNSLDLDLVRPPARLTAEMLSAFCQSIDRHFGQ
jgi:hypothetical protein